MSPKSEGNQANNRKLGKSRRQTPRNERPHVPRPVSVSRIPPVYAATSRRASLRYSNGVVLTGSSGALNYIGYRINGAFDPDISVGGHQPMGFDQYTAFFERFTVLSSRITIDVYPTSSVPTVVGIGAIPDITTSYTNFTQWIESGTATYKILPADLSVPVRLTRTSRVAALFDKVDVLDDPNFSGSVNADPATQGGFFVFVQDLNSTSTCTIQFALCIEYDILFTDPRMLASS